MSQKVKKIDLYTVVFTLFGAYIEPRRGEIWAGSLIRIFAAFGMSEEAVRKFLSRIRQKGLIQSRRRGRQSYYSLTENGRAATKTGEHRGLAARSTTWSGEWHLLTYRIPEEQRPLRDKLRSRLTWLGYANLASSTWISPHDQSDDLNRFLALAGAEDYVERFTARYQTASNQALAARLWNLAGLNEQYRAFLAEYQPQFEAHKDNLARGIETASEACFVQLFELILDYLNLGFADPNLPPDLLPDAWAAWEAETLYREHRKLLTEPANRFFDSVFKGPPLNI